MSSPDASPLHHPLSTLKHPAPIATTPGLPSPPLSVHGEFDLDLDLSAPDLVNLAGTPTSTAIVSPKTASPGVSPTTRATFSIDTTDLAPRSPSTTAEALSAHHLERYFHYKALASQAQTELSISLLNGRLMGDDNALFKDRTAPANPAAAMLALSQPAQPFFHPPAPASNQSLWNNTFTYQQQQQQQQQQQAQALQAQAAQAQAQAHLQAHEVAQQAVAAQRMSMSNYYMPPSAPGTTFDGTQAPPLWSRQSGSNTSVSAASPPFPSTPTYGSATDTQGASSFSSIPAPSKNKDIDEHDELDNVSDRASSASSGAVNVHGGGRGYIPGKTPDDPKKRHKCTVCGRGFARAFNLKSHIQTHDPLRPKPHQCPHPLCKRSFSRLHDLERHRQGIHSDGPLVDAKRQGVSPSVVHAQSRLQRRAESGGLI